MPTLRAQDLPAELTVENKSLLLILDPRDGTLSVRDKRNGKVWSQQTSSREVSFTRVATVPDHPGKIELQGFAGVGKTPCECELALDGDLPEFTVSLAGEGDLKGPLTFPQPFVGGKDLIVPLNEGIRYPVNDATIRDLSLVTYGGHGICMPFWGLTDGDAGQMAIFETPDDGRIHIKRQGKSLCVEPQWDSQKGKFGYERRLR